MKKKAVLLLAAVWALASAASAAPAVKTTTKVVMPKGGKTVIDFTAITIDGKVKMPLGAFVMEHKDKTFDKLLDINESFLEQIVKAADEY